MRTYQKLEQSAVCVAKLETDCGYLLDLSGVCCHKIKTRDDSMPSDQSHQIS